MFKDVPLPKSLTDAAKVWGLGFLLLTGFREFNSSGLAEGMATDFAALTGAVESTSMIAAGDLLKASGIGAGVSMILAAAATNNENGNS